MSDSLDFLDGGSESPQLLKDLQEMADRLTEMEFNYVTAQEKADQAKKIYDEFRCITLPNAFRMAGVTGLQTTSGARVSIERKYYCTPNKNAEDQDAMCAWLAAHGGEDLIKTQAIVDTTQYDKLLASGIPHAVKRDVNTNSLKAWLKRSVGEGSVAAFEIKDVPSCMHFLCLDEAKVEL